MSFSELFVLGLLGVLLFGKQLPTVGRKLGKTYGELKRSYDAFKNEMKDAIKEAENADAPTSARKTSETKLIASDDGDVVVSSAPKFEPPKD